MSETIYPGRFCGQFPEGAGAVFLIGARVNTLRGLRRSGPVFSAMPRMLKHLSVHPEAGLLGFANWFGRTTMLVSYWRSAEDVQRFASDPSAPHAEAWRRFVRRIGNSGDIGVWHELYSVTPGSYESVYLNMPEFGLGAAGRHVAVTDGLRTSKQRMASVG